MDDELIYITNSFYEFVLRKLKGDQKDFYISSELYNSFMGNLNSPLRIEYDVISAIEFVKDYENIIDNLNEG